ncbi:SPW repeat protein [Planosporangium thailandense]|uniref:SPW repeat protein n=1 Tax=Planosporangium thailandense TaxID=765197 RepID=A0ABX0XZA2_9ACTN|nr:SPW repeat protein [Planosporangium thailandense]NJC71227.1 SPW repeat protein [Planosporangium thailandense]
MRERYERITESGQAVVIDGLVLLAGAWLAISPWVVHFNAVARDVAVNNLILGGLVAIIGLGLTMTPARMYRLSWAAAAIGVWTIAAPWVIRLGSPGFGVWINNLVTGVITTLLGVGAAAMLVAKGSPRRGAAPAR